MPVKRTLSHASAHAACKQRQAPKAKPSAESGEREDSGLSSFVGQRAAWRCRDWRGNAAHSCQTEFLQEPIRENNYRKHCRERGMDLKPLVTLLAIVNPLAIVPFFIHYTQGFSEAQRKRTIRTAAFSAFCVIAACALLGLQILEFFNISLPSFQVGGGMLLLISSMNMLNAQPAEAKPATNELEEGAEKAAAGASIAVVPLTIPLLTGPASMSTVVIYANNAQTFWQQVALVGYGLVIGLATWVCFSLADPIARVLGKTGINVMTRLMGLILAALAVEVMAGGLAKIFPVLLGH